MVMLVSTPWWKIQPTDQESRVRHFVPSPSFRRQFASVMPDALLDDVDLNTRQRKGGPVGDFSCCLSDVNGQPYEFRGECFFNRHYILTLLVCIGTLGKGRIIVPGAVGLSVNPEEVW
jgi:hypothetical protein